CRLKAEGWFAEAARHALENLGTGRNAAAEAGVSRREKRVLECGLGRLCGDAERRQGGALPIMDMIEKHGLRGSLAEPSEFGSGLILEPLLQCSNDESQSW